MSRAPFQVLLFPFPLLSQFLVLRVSTFLLKVLRSKGIFLQTLMPFPQLFLFLICCAFSQVKLSPVNQFSRTSVLVNFGGLFYINMIPLPWQLKVLRALYYLPLLPAFLSLGLCCGTCGYSGSPLSSKASLGSPYTFLLVFGY